MTIQGAIDKADKLKPNMMHESIKVDFLNEIEGKVFHEILMKHEHPEDMQCPHYDTDTDPGTTLLVPAPYDMLYVYWLMAQIDHLNQEMDHYNNDRSLFEDAWGNFGDYWTREHMPICRNREFRI